jgi:hypothetical protein
MGSNEDKTMYTGGPFTVFLKNLEGKTRTLNMNGPNDTIKMLKERVQEKESVSPETQRLLFGSHQLEDNDKTLAYYDIQKNSTVWLVLRLRGGL